MHSQSTMLALTKMWLQIRLWCIISQHSSSSNTYIQNSQVIRKGDEALKEIAPRKRDISLCGYIRLGQTWTRCLLLQPSLIPFSVIPQQEKHCQGRQFQKTKASKYINMCLSQRKHQNHPHAQSATRTTISDNQWKQKFGFS